ncbi:hypothetical protein J3B02_005183 [Coemansia erecta]|nr:hypothetical protein J3B02_005183 [Coemansia erecta]
MEYSSFICKRSVIGSAIDSQNQVETNSINKNTGAHPAANNANVCCIASWDSDR